MKILAIDDKRDNLISLKAIIKDKFRDAELYIASDGPEGINIANKVDPDVILLDIVMPGMDGFEVCTVLKNDEKTKDIPVVFVTALKGDKQSRITSLEVGGEAFLAKPIDESELIAQIKAMVRIKEARNDKKLEAIHLEKLVKEKTQEIEKELLLRKNAQMQLNISENKFKYVLNNSLMTIYNFNFKTGTYDYVSPSSSEMYGYTPSEFIVGGIKFTLTNIHNDDLERMRNHLTKLLSNELVDFTPTIEYRFNHPKKGYRWISDTRSVIFNDDGSPKSIIGNAKDITENKANDHTLIRLSTAVAQSPSIIAITDLEGVLEYVNPKFEALTGYTSAEAIGKSSSLLKSGEQKDEFYSKLWETITMGNEWRGEFHNKKKNGELFWEAASISPIYDKSHKLVSYIKVGEDITNRKRTEQIQKVLYNITNAILTTYSLSGFISAIQVELAEIFDSENLYVAFYDEKLDLLTFPFYSDTKDSFEAISAKKTLTKYVIDTGRPLLANIELKKKLASEGVIEYKGSLSKIWLGVPLKVNSSIIGVIAVQSYKDENAYTEEDLKIFEFVSEQVSILIDRKKQEFDLRTALEKATESDRLKSAFLATMSHELRTPLNAIIGFSSLLLENLPENEVVNYSKIINTSGIQLLSIVEDMFDITLIESGETKIRKSDCDLYHILNDVNKIIKIEKEKTGKTHIPVNLISPAKQNGLILNTDQNKIKQILLNLLKNALKFTVEGHVHYGFKKDIYQNESVIKFFVKDTGIGIHEDKKDIIFDVFQQVDDSHTREYGGTGIGLSIAYKLTKLLEGDIWVESELGKGSIFYFTIPCKEIKCDEKRSESLISQVLSSNTSKPKDTLNNKTILIAEDEETSFQFLKIVLDSFKMNILWAKNGKDAIELCKSNPNICLILMDIKMPIMNGYEATKEIRQFMPNVPIIAQTAYAISGDREKVFEAGCDDYISKPIDQEILIDTISSYLM